VPAIYIDRRDALLDADGGALVVRLDGARVATLPLAGADRVVVRRAGALTLRLLAALGERGVGLLVLGGRKGEPMAHLLGLPHADAAIRRGQFHLAATPDRALAIARLAVKGKLVGHLGLLRDAMAARPDLRKPLFDAVGDHERAYEELGHAHDLGSLRGREGAAAAAFFRGYTSLFAPALGFVERNRRPPRDPVNACLSLAYTLLHAEAVRAAWVAGLDPQVGFLHALLPGRDSLACDLAELGRPGMDRLVWQLFRERVLRTEDFSMTDGACLMGKSGRAAFYEAYEQAAPVERRRLRHAAAALARVARTAAAPGYPP
jgi:CRISPR-associated protein Cas1